MALWPVSECRCLQLPFLTMSPMVSLILADASNEKLLGFFENAIKQTGCSGKTTLHEGSHQGPIPKVTSASGPEFKAVKQAIQEIWRDKDGAVSDRVITHKCGPVSGRVI